MTSNGCNYFASRGIGGVEGRDILIWGGTTVTGT